MDQAAAVAALRQSRHSLHSFVAASCSDPNMGVVCNITTGPELAGNDEGNGFSVDDAIEMYLDGFSDADDGDGDEEMADAAEELTSPSNHTSAGETISSEAAAASHGWPLSDSGTQGVCETLPESHTFQQPGATALGQHAPASAQLSPAEKRLSLNPLSSNPVLLRTDMALHADHRRSSAILAQKPRERFELPSDFTRTPPPPLTRGSPTRDRYGFHKTSAGGITLEQYDRWNHSYAPYQEERRKKWSDLIEHTTGAHGQHVIFPAKSNKIKRLIRKGIPPEYRGAAWFNYSGGDQIYHKNPGLYRRLVEEAWDSDMNDDKEHIERDLHRTFPDNMHFKPDTSEANDSEGSASGTSDSVRTTPSEPGIIQSLRRVLYAFALHNSKIGYTQSLNFIAGMLLLLLPEEKAFWMLHVITSRYLPATHEINLEGADVDLWILMVLLREQLPVVYSKIADTHSTNRNKPPVMEESADLPVITLGLTNWLMSLFLGSLPWETTLRVWDVFFYEGSRTFFRVGLGIFRSCESRILAVNDSSEIFQIVQKAPKKLLDANAFIEDCFSKKYHRITQQRIENLRRARRRALHAKREEMHAPSGQTSCAASDHMRPKTGHTWRSLRHHAFNRI
ncbi:hypothetical protein KEM52_003316 [Ascosphaera acerosa]|nr:hypothetical protein KEM52_003316 [Ascosphaera acerosa]